MPNKEEEEMIMFVMVMVLGLCAAGAETETEVEVKKIDGYGTFEEDGVVYPQGEMASLSFSLKMSDVMDKIELFKKNLRGMPNVMEEMMLVGREISEDVDLFEEEARRKARDVISWFFGIFNWWSESELAARVDEVEENEELIATTVDAIEDAARENRRNIEGIVMEQQEDKRKWRVKEAWHFLKERLDDVGAVMMAALDHRVSPAIRNLVDVAGAWSELQEKLKAQGKRSVVRNFLHLLNMKADIVYEGGSNTLFLVVAIPVVEAGTEPMRRYRWRGGPLMVGDELVEIDEDRDTSLMVDKSGQTYMEKRPDQMDQCASHGKEMVCFGVNVIHTKPGSSCLFAVWNRDIVQSRELCQFKRVPRKTRTWDLNSTSVAIFVPRKVEATVECRGNPKPPVPLEGLEEINFLGDECQVKLPGISVASGATGKIRERVVVRLNGTEVVEKEEKQTNYTTWDFDHISAQVRERIEKKNWSPMQLATIIIASLAVMVVVGFIAFAYFRFRKHGQGVGLPV